MVYSAAALLKALVRFPSLSHQEGAIASFVEEYVQRCGVQIRRLADSVYFWIGHGSRRLLLNSHLDVVPPSSGHPFDPLIQPKLTD